MMFLASIVLIKQFEKNYRFCIHTSMKIPHCNCIRHRNIRCDRITQMTNLNILIKPSVN